MKIAILGSRGIPNTYGGFEQFASCIAPLLVGKGHQVVVYNTASNGYSARSWQGVEIVTKYDAHKILGTTGQFVYDFLCIMDARKRGYDLIVQLGYTSSSIWSFLLPRKARIVTNMDGLEWRRSKYNRVTRQFLQYAEKWATQSSDLLIADAIAIREYLLAKYGRVAVYIPYGADAFNAPDPAILTAYQLQPYAYNLLIARPEPENHLEIIMKGSLKAIGCKPLVVIGNGHNRYGKYLRKQYVHPRIVFIDNLYDRTILNNLRYYSHIYFHGHSVGGTNPSLLEAMAAQCLILAHDNVFNREVLGGDAYYFAGEEDVTRLLNQNLLKSAHHCFLEDNVRKIQTWYNWENVLHLMEEVMVK